MSGPVVAVTTDATTVNWSIWGDTSAVVLPWTYVAKVTEAGGSPLLLPPVPEAVDDVLAAVDALLLTGGADIHPSRYGAERHPRTLPPDEQRDATDFAALAVAERRGIPVLGICRGLQVISIARGGTLHQHLPEHGPTVPGRHTLRPVRIAENSVLGAAMGTAFTGHCHHHQGVDRLGEGLVASAWADDGVIEGAEDPSARFLVGVQPHAEEGSDTAALFKAFVDAAR